MWPYPYITIFNHVRSYISWCICLVTPHHVDAGLKSVSPTAQQLRKCRVDNKEKLNSCLNQTLNDLRPFLPTGEFLCDQRLPSCPRPDLLYCSYLFPVTKVIILIVVPWPATFPAHRWVVTIRVFLFAHDLILPVALPYVLHRCDPSGSRLSRSSLPVTILVASSLSPSSPASL